MWWVLLIAGLLVRAGSTLLIDAWLNRRPRVDLAERLLPFPPGTVAEEASDWLRRGGQTP